LRIPRLFKPFLRLKCAKESKAYHWALPKPVEGAKQEGAWVPKATGGAVEPKARLNPG